MCSGPVALGLTTSSEDASTEKSKICCSALAICGTIVDNELSSSSTTSCALPAGNAGGHSPKLPGINILGTDISLAFRGRGLDSGGVKLDIWEIPITVHEPAFYDSDLFQIQCVVTESFRHTGAAIKKTFTPLSS